MHTPNPTLALNNHSHNPKPLIIHFHNSKPLKVRGGHCGADYRQAQQAAVGVEEDGHYGAVPREV